MYFILILWNRRKQQYLIFFYTRENGASARLSHIYKIVGLEGFTSDLRTLIIYIFISSALFQTYCAVSKGIAMELNQTALNLSDYNSQQKWPDSSDVVKDDIQSL